MSTIKRFELPLFFILTFAITWSIWGPQMAAKLGWGGSGVTADSPLNLVAIWGPGFAAMIVSLLVGGWGGLRALWGRIKRWRVSPLWYGLALFLPALTWVVARGIDTALGIQYELVNLLVQALGPDGLRMVPFFVVFTLPNALGEELGWRGFAQPRLQARFGPVGASLILGFFWGLWHVPTWIAQNQAANILPLWGFTVVGAFLFTFLFNQTQGSLLLCWLSHTAITATSYILPPIPSYTDDLILAGLVVVIMATGRFWKPIAE